MDLARDLQVTISSRNEALAKNEPCEIKVRVENTGSAEVTLLKWGSPLDRISPMLGVFEVHDTETNAQVEMPLMKLSRKLPPEEDDLVEIAPSGFAEAIVKLPSFDFQPGHSYSIQARGWWQAAWELPKQNVVSAHLRDISAGTSGSFSSNIIVVSRVRNQTRCIEEKGRKTGSADRDKFS